MNIRALALASLNRILQSKSYSNIVLDTVIRRHGLDCKDRALFCRMVYGVVEKKITLDHLIDTLSSKPPCSIEPEVRNILRLGLYQLRYLDRVPPHAACDETVALSGARSRGFVNAILRRYLRESDCIPFPSRESDFLAYLSVTYSYPKEFCERLTAEYGGDKAEEILGAFDGTPPITLRVNTLKTSRDTLLSELAAKGITARPTANSSVGIKATGSPSELGLADGLAFVQDEASQIATLVLDAKEGDTVYDICACPGSKSFGAALTMQNTGKLIAFDIHENKLSLVEKGAENLGITILTTRARDGRDFDETLSGGADRIICDVPCSGFGVVAKKPEIRYKSLAECDSLPAIQYDILNNACRYLKKGGYLIYSTCTIFSAENDGVISRFLKSHEDFELVPFKVGEIEAPKGSITLLPCDHGTDGFFIAKLRRKENSHANR